MAKYVPKSANKLLTFVPGKGLEELTGIASRLMRAKILLDRETRGFGKVDRNGPREAYEFEYSDKEQPGTKKHRFEVNQNYSTGRGTQIETSGYTHEQEKKISRINSNIKDYISIVDIDFRPDDHKTTRHYAYLQLPFVPRELDYQPESNFVGIASFGRNNPFYQFTGSEDTLTFEVDWFAEKESREDVIFNCRWLEALTKGDGYEEPPHRVRIVWGSDNKLFEDSIWLLVAAPYRLSNFNRGYMSDGNFISTAMLPQQAYQTVTFKRLTDDNMRSSNIIGKVPS